MITLDITFEEVLEKAAKSGAFSLSLNSMLRAYNERQRQIHEDGSVGSIAKANKVFAEKCAINIETMDHAMNISANELAGRKLCLVS
tara:strand:+ start:8360 stop:8620 length:261 start_codon:yes stop_codon:yes gene_type:complete